MQYLRATIIYVLLMTLVVVASNFLVQFPVLGSLFGIQLSNLLTWGAFIYPAAFLVTDLTNRQFGPKIARRVVFAGFVVGVAISYYTSLPRIAMASGTAYLVGQLLDISVFNRLRRQTWWQAPLAGSLFGSMLDTVLFFSLSFAPAFAFLGANDDFAISQAPILGIFAAEAPRWISWAIGDFVVKLLVGLVMLLPYGALMSVLKPMPPAKAA
ncbi:queuosine precursor transporter [Rhizobium sp. CSW-27]|uniref:queuosine precursor transporter n=1 Tax=Rhizobium sp. CSW-27 TaxID=2839985 RepID=UPI001C00C147|nr:queuosine precursor transporter [Rhizobium sp. CSW-27]MBT9370789.1 queuosine precursor transporter [Rhizobium sp. CSW-27]